MTVTTANNQTASTSFTVSPSLPTISGIVVSGPASSGAPISASVQLYAAGTTGYGAGAQAIGDPVQTDSKTGAFPESPMSCSTLVARVISCIWKLSATALKWFSWRRWVRVVH